MGADGRAIASASELVGLRTRARIPPFELHEPATVADAVAEKQRNPGAVFMAGGIDLINRMKAGSNIASVIHIGRVAALRTIDRAAETITLGAAVTHDEIATSAVLREHCPGLAALWGRIANPRIRFKGTVGGNLMAREPGYEAGALLAAAEARLRFAGSGQDTIIALEQFPAATTADLLLAGVMVPVQPARRFVYDRSLKGIAGVVVSGTVTDGRVGALRAAISWAYPHVVSKPIPLTGAASARDLAAAAEEIAAAWCGDLPPPIADHLASSAYRRRIVEVRLRRGLQALANRIPA